MDPARIKCSVCCGVSVAFPEPQIPNSGRSHRAFLPSLPVWDCLSAPGGIAMRTTTACYLPAVSRQIPGQKFFLEH